MGNKCCSKRPEQDFTLPHSGGYNSKKNAELGFTSGITVGGLGGGGVGAGLGGIGGNNGGIGKHSINGGSLDSRYTPDPNRGPLKQLAKGGVDIIRPRTTPCGM